MSNCRTYQDLFDEINWDINQDRVTAMFWEDKKYFIKKVRWALNKIYRFHNRNWTVEKEATLAPITWSWWKKFILPKSPLWIMAAYWVKWELNNSSCWCWTWECSWWEPLTVVKSVEKCSDSWCVISLSWREITSSCPFDSLVITYRRVPDMPDLWCSCNCDDCDETCGDLCNYEIDCPEIFSDILKDLILSDMFHLWMWEWVWTYMRMFYDRAYIELWRQQSIENLVSWVKQSFKPSK